MASLEPSDAPPVGDDDIEEEEAEDVMDMADVSMDPNHPLLARAQAALESQLVTAKETVELQLREKAEALKVAKTQREQIGVDLYGQQQQLAKLQISLDRIAHDYQASAEARQGSEAALKEIREVTEEISKDTKVRQEKVAESQKEFDKLASTLKQIEAYSEEMKNEISVTRRATFVAEENITKKEKVKQEQDLLIDHLQETLKHENQRLKLYDAQLIAQAHETKVAQEALNEASLEMESINFEKKQLVQRWKSSLLAISRRDEALQATEDALRKQREQQLAMESEIEGYKKSVRTEQIKNEQLTSVLKKLEGEAEFLKKQLVQVQEKKDRLHETHVKLSNSLEQTEKAVHKAEQEGQNVRSEIQVVDKTIVRLNQDIQDLELQMLNNVSDQTTMEKSSQKTIQHTKKTVKAIKEEEINIINLNNEIAKIRVDLLNTQAHNSRLEETLKALDDELKEKSRTIQRYEIEIRRRNDEIEKKTSEMDRLNRAYEKIIGNRTEENMGPLEATIRNMQREINSKSLESKELQKRWMALQTELVRMQHENNDLKETIQRMKSKHAILIQKRSRLTNQHEQYNGDIKKLDTSIEHMHYDMTRLNTLIAQHTQLQSDLANENFNLETKIMNQLHELEAETNELIEKIKGKESEKRQIVSEMVEYERQILLWERKIQLEREMQAAIDPNVGQDVVGAMKKEIHRMKLRYQELQRQQEKLIADMERAIHKREFIATKGRASALQQKTGVALTEAGLKKHAAELQKRVRETNKKAKVVERVVKELAKEREAKVNELDYEVEQLDSLKEAGTGLAQEIDEFRMQRELSLFNTVLNQRKLKCFEDAKEGKFKALGNEAKVESEHDKARVVHEKIASVVTRLREKFPELGKGLDKVEAFLSTEV